MTVKSSYHAHTVTDNGTGDSKLKVTIGDADTKTVDNNTIVEMTSEETILHFGLKIPKQDRERVDAKQSNTSEPQGKATFKGVVYEIYNANSTSVWIDLDGGTNYKEYKSGALITTITSTNDDGSISLPAVLPYGYYEVKETEPPEGYLNSGYDQVLPTDAFLNEINDSKKDGKIYEATEQPNNEQVERFGFSIHKIDEETQIKDTPEGDADLKADFEVVNESDHSVQVNGKWYNTGDVVWTFTTDSNGAYTSANNLLPYGKYLIREVKASTGYLGPEDVGTYARAKDGTYEIHFEYTEGTDKDGDIKDLGYTIEDPVVRGGVTVQKRDAEQKNSGETSGFGDTTPEGSAVLSGTVYNIYNLSNHNVLVDKNGNGKYDEDELFKPYQLVYTITTDESGIASTAKDTLPYGTYVIVEESAPQGYLQPNEHYLSDSEAAELGLVYNADQDIYYVNGTCYFYNAKEKEFYSYVAWTTNNEKRLYCEDGMTWDGKEKIENLYNADTDSYIGSDGTRYFYDRDKGQYYYLSEADNNYVNYTYGIYAREFEIREEEVIVDLTEQDSSIYDLVKRGDFQMRKIESESQKPMAGVEFRVTSMTTGESHTFVTDENGEYSSASSVNPHASETGLWFGLDADGNNVPIDETLGALPYDTYLIEEIEGEANAGMNMISFQFFITDDNTFAKVGYVNDLGDLEDSEYVLASVATSESSGNHNVSTEEETEIDDNIFYDHLTAGTYRVVTYLVDADTGRILVDENGEEIIASREVEITDTEGYVRTELDFDSLGLEGVNAVVYEYFYRINEDGTETLVYNHTDINDEEQTVSFFGIGTTATDENGYSDEVNASSELTIVDTVEYSNLDANRTYTVTGTLMLKSTGEKYLDDNGNEVTASTTFTTDETGSGTVEVVFGPFSGQNLAGEAVVVYEDLYRGDTVYAVHEEISDDGQTVYFPKIHTNATDSETGTHTGNAESSETVTIVDVVTYEGLTEGETYVMSGTLTYKDTGETVVDENNNPYTAEEEFVAAEGGYGTVTLTYEIPASL